jgi:hypothetical protein
VTRWHDILQDYFRKKPDDDSRYKLSLDIGLSEASAEEINSIVKNLKGVPRTKLLMDQFIQLLEGLLK